MPPKSKPKGLTAVESQLYQSGLAKDNRILTMPDIMALPGIKIDQALKDALNSLMKKSLFNVLKDGNGQLCYKVMDAGEAKSLASMEGDEKLVLDYVTDAGNQAIWTRTLKMRTNLHQTVINRVLKSLEQKKLIKAVKAVKYPTRKMYMREHLQPSIELTGGPWFSDNELDVEFVSVLLRLISKFLAERTFPTQPHNGGGTRLYPVQHNAYLPSLADVTKMIRSKNVTSVELQAEHVESLIDVLIADGEVEAVFVTETKNVEDEEEEEEEDEEEEEEEEEEESDESDEVGKKRKRKGGKEATKKKVKIEKGKGKKVSFEDEIENEEEEGDEGADEFESIKSKKKMSKSKKTKRQKKHSLFNGFNFAGPTTVYRSLLNHRPSPLVGITTVPCGHCPVFDLCKYQGTPAATKKVKEKEAIGMIGGWMSATGTSVGGVGVGDRRRDPVNPVECRYYEDWLKW